MCAYILFGGSDISTANAGGTLELNFFANSLNVASLLENTS